MNAPSGNPRATLRRLCSEESGQALVFAALTAFMLASFIIFVADLGRVTSTRVQVQNAADECAYGAALYEANVISSVAYLNESMAYLYYDGLRYAVDTTRTGVLASLKRYGPPYPDDALVYNDEDADAPGLSGSPIDAYERAYGRAREWLPRIERTLSMMSRWEWGMALGCEDLVKMEIFRAAHQHGIEAVAVYPDIKFYPGDGIEFDLHILRLIQDGRWVGWRIWNQEGYTVEARNVAQYHWIITNPDREVFDIQRLSDVTYRIQTPTDEITIDRFSDAHVRVTRVRHTQDGNKTTVIDTRYVEGFGWSATITDESYTVGYSPFRDDGYWLEIDNHQTGESASAGLRIGPNGHLQQWGGGGWSDVPGQQDSVNVGGANVPVQSDPRVIRFGNGDYFRFPNHFRLSGMDYSIPIKTIDFNGGRAILLEDKMRVEAWLPIPTPAGSTRLHFVLDELWDELIVHGVLRSYHVPRDADCRWFSTRDGRQRDRLCRDCQLLEGECGSPGGREREWTYQYRKDAPIFGREDMRRFAHHAICDRDTYAQTHAYQYPEWTQWYNTALGEPNGTDYYQTRPRWGAESNYDSDGDGELDSVRLYAYQTGALNRDGSRSFDPHWRMVKPFNLRSVARFVPPLKLNEEFFQFALIVGCWRGRHGGLHPEGLFRNPAWGYVGVASARAGFLETVSDDAMDVGPHYRFTWPTRAEVERFVASGYENLYEPVWTAHLWSVRDAIKDDHIKAYVDNQTGLSYLMEGLLRTYWVEPLPPEKIGDDPKERSEVPGLLARMGLRAGDPRMNSVVQH